MSSNPLRQLRLRDLFLALLFGGGALCSTATAASQDADQGGEEAVESRAIDSSSCGECHELSEVKTMIVEELSHSAHEGFECLDCHQDMDTDPHRPKAGFRSGFTECSECHEEEAAAYQAHGRALLGESADMPTCADCHGNHDILSPDVKHSRVHPTELPHTCGRCHENLDLTTKYMILLDHPVEIYEASVHGQAARGGVYLAATCNDCHSTAGTSHKILAPSYPDSSINHFNIPATCGKCHRAVENDYWEGIHGQLARRGETDAPVCTTCHGEHGILSPDDPRSPVSKAKVAEATCAPCHGSTRLNEKYGLTPDRLTTFIDSYHGLKTKAGDTHVANCASCHGVHRVLPSTDPTSTIHPANLQHTCGECHPGISFQMASSPIHGLSGNGLRTPVADVVAKIYIVAIVVIIGLMVLHWILDLGRQIKNLLDRRPQLRRMRVSEVWQHHLLALSFIVLVVSGFSLRYEQVAFTTFLFGWEGGFQFRGTLHRSAAVVFGLTVVWHALFLSTKRGRAFLRDMMPAAADFTGFLQKILYNVGRRSRPPRFGRFSYVEKAEYWALVWGTAVMILTGFMLWFDNTVVQLLPKGFLDVALVVHFWEAWLATLAIVVWHLYSVLFDPAVYPMNPSWLTGTMPEEMYAHEHPEHLEAARADTEAMLAEVRARVRRREAENQGTGEGPAPS
ncbi:MAG: cytochrome b/b6 domain-containing protein [Planctomycetota bacterium]